MLLSWAEQTGQQEVTELAAGMDFRLPQYRREVFLRFYEFHLRYRAHPGAVYYLLPEFAARQGWDIEQRLWFAYLNGLTQNPCTTWVIFNTWPEPPRQPGGITTWFNEHWPLLAFDTDRRHQKKDFPAAVEDYLRRTNGQQAAYFYTLLDNAGTEEEGFENLWAAVRGSFYSFGRLSSFSYLEYLRLAGLPIQPGHLLFSDMEGSRSHRNGLLKVLGRDDLYWHKGRPAPAYNPEDFAGMEQHAQALLQQATRRAETAETPLASAYPIEATHVTLFTLESAFCTYKSWHLPRRRYPNVYNDMLHDRIKAAEQAWPELNFAPFWETREKYLPSRLRLENNPKDVGVKAPKQNHYLNTGQVIMMDLDWGCFANDYSVNLEST